MQVLQAELATAARARNLNQILILLKSYIESSDVNTLNEVGALHWACYIGSTHLVDCLLHLGCDIFYAEKLNLDTPCHYAVKGANFDVLLILYKEGGMDILSKRNRNDMTPFLIASAEVSEEHISEILRILEWMYIKGISLEEQDILGQTALFWSSKRGCLHIVQWLLSKGCNLNHRDHVGRTVLHAACLTNSTFQQDYQDTILFLCEKGAINLINSKSFENENPHGDSVFKVCLLRRHFLMCICLMKWVIQYELFGFVRIFRSSYSLYYWFFTVVNLLLFLNMATNLLSLGSGQGNLLFSWVVLWTITQVFWFIAFASDPGFVIRCTIPNQFTRTSPDYYNDANSSPVYSESQGSTLWALQELERKQLLINLRLVDLKKMCLKQGVVDIREYPQYIECFDELFSIRQKMIEIMPFVSQERIAKYPASYISALQSNSPSVKTICVTCRIIKPLRTHHCADCAHCIKREDHHCVWIDNCVAFKNQRSFWFFLLFLTSCIFCNFAVIRYYFLNFYYKPQHFVMISLLLLFGVFLNILWACFVLYLFFRTTKAMITDVTFCEYLKKPDYIRRRFKNNLEGYFWDFNDLTLDKIYQNIVAFWTLQDSSDQTEEIFRQMNPDDFLQHRKTLNMPLAEMTTSDYINSNFDRHSNCNESLVSKYPVYGDYMDDYQSKYIPLH